jgi:hypothetical protein
LNKTVIVQNSSELTGLGTARLAMVGAGVKNLPPTPPPRALIRPEAPLGEQLRQKFSEAVARSRNWK